MWRTCPVLFGGFARGGRTWQGAAARASVGGAGNGLRWLVGAEHALEPVDVARTVPSLAHFTVGWARLCYHRVSTSS